MNSLKFSSKSSPSPVSIAVRSSCSLALTAAFLLTSCGLSPEAQKKAREEKLQTFAETVTKHLLDKNPETLKMSITTFMRDEVNDTERDKLQEQKIIPDSPISVERIEQENQAAGRSNEVNITSVKAVSPIDQDYVKFQVAGNEVSKLKGKAVDTKPFNYELTVLLNGEMSGYPRLTDLKGFVAPSATADSGAQNSSKTNKRSKRRRG